MCHSRMSGALWCKEGGMPLDSRRKGARGEREWAQWLAKTFHIRAHRGCQFRGGPDSPDVVGGIPGTHCEVKRVERLHLHDALSQAVRDCGDLVPYVAHRSNRKEWVVILRAEDILRFARAVVAAGGHAGDGSGAAEGV